MENSSISDQTAGPAIAPSPPPQMQLEVSDCDAASSYANFCRISGSPEELLIDFGLNPQPTGTPEQPIVVSQRIVTSWFTTKRLLGVLQMTVARHEAAFGVLETDVQRRVQR